MLILVKGAEVEDGVIEPTAVNTSRAAHPLDRPAAIVGLMWAVFPSVIGAIDLVSAWSNYEALVHHRNGFFGLSGSTLPLLSGLTFLVWFPLTLAWFVLLAVRFLTGPITMRRLVFPIVVAAVIVAVALFAIARSRHTEIEFDPAPRLLTSYFWYSALILLGGLAAAGLSVWLLKPPSTNTSRSEVYPPT